MSAADRLARLLFIVPYVTHRDGVPLAELAQKLDVRPAKLEADLDLLSMVGQPPLTPDHLIDLYVEDDVVYVDLDQSLTRPLRLTHDEARALAVAAKLVGRLGGLGEELDKVVERILEHLGSRDAEYVRSVSKRIGLWDDGPQEESMSMELRQAIESRLEIAIDYYSASSDQKKSYCLQPLALINHTGVDYLVALDVGADKQEKLFRLDRLAAASVSSEHFEAPDTIDLEKYRTRTLYMGSDGQSCLIRFSSKVASLVRERFADRQVEEFPDGSLEVRLSTSSLAWLARWVLPFGVDAEVTEPQDFRGHFLQLCTEAVEAYGS